AFRLTAELLVISLYRGGQPRSGERASDGRRGAGRLDRAYPQARTSARATVGLAQIARAMTSAWSRSSVMLIVSHSTPLRRAPTTWIAWRSPPAGSSSTPPNAAARPNPRG